MLISNWENIKQSCNNYPAEKARVGGATAGLATAAANIAATGLAATGRLSVIEEKALSYSS